MKQGNPNLSRHILILNFNGPLLEYWCCKIRQIFEKAFVIPDFTYDGKYLYCYMYEVTCLFHEMHSLALMAQCALYNEHCPS